MSGGDQDLGHHTVRRCTQHRLHLHGLQRQQRLAADDLLADGVREGVMLTREDLDEAGREAARHDPTLRHWVYGRAGLPCRVCGTPVVVEEMATRKLYRCPRCQV